ncbi:MULTISPECIES: CsbA family protein [unclassified Domibacillus]|uniref:CsbA family protein n=1 Tax=unclassified Domibacillus TaxID=2632383 RepID=UPI001F59F2C7|nr:MULTISPECIES: CsbA family protein [unclassified Domibacillus]MCI2252956.1 CsbA family protein [Domibacillus sp. PGB-M46]
MVDQLILAMFMPALLVLLFSRVTYNQFLGVILTVALIAASAYKGYTHTWELIVMDAFSITAGLWLSNRMMKRLKVKLN